MGNMYGYEWHMLLAFDFDSSKTVMLPRLPRL